jgi:hypothetical protein
MATRGADTYIIHNFSVIYYSVLEIYSTKLLLHHHYCITLSGNHAIEDHEGAIWEPRRSRSGPKRPQPICLVTRYQCRWRRLDPLTIFAWAPVTVRSSAAMLGWGAAESWLGVGNLPANGFASRIWARLCVKRVGIVGRAGGPVHSSSSIVISCPLKRSLLGRVR